MTIEVLGVDNILLAVGNLAEARAFYEQKLKLPVKFVFEGAGLAAYRLGPEEPGLLIRAQPIEAQEPSESPRLWLEVADARQAAQELVGSGIEPIKEPWEVATGWVVEFADPWGNVIGLTDYVKAPKRSRLRREEH
jgi:predicted enzyme related to lactoylglutathione lyase